MQKQAQEFSKKCDQCQIFAPTIHQPGGVLNPVSSPWPFSQWGLDIMENNEEHRRGPCHGTGIMVWKNKPYGTGPYFCLMKVLS